jgi:hypothetical protein
MWDSVHTISNTSTHTFTDRATFKHPVFVTHDSTDLLADGCADNGTVSCTHDQPNVGANNITNNVSNIFTFYFAN